MHEEGKHYAMKLHAVVRRGPSLSEVTVTDEGWDLVRDRIYNHKANDEQ